MKKVFYSIALMMVAVFSSVLLTGCGDPEPQSLKIKADSVQTSVLVNDQFNSDGLKVIVTYDDGSTQTVSKNNDMTISSINTSQVGKQTLTVKYLGLTATISINVYATANDRDYQIYGFQVPEAYADHVERKGNAGGANFKDASKDNYFAKNDSSYKVGDDNPFVFFPKVSVMSKTDHTSRFQLEEGDQFASIVVVKELQGQNYVTLEGSALTEKVAVNTLTSTYDFTDAAVGKKYQITVQPEQMTTPATYSPITFEVEVVDGWNVYDEYNLSRIDNSTTALAGEISSSAVWADFKQTHGVGSEATKAIVLHRDMLLTKEHIPAEYIWGSDAGEHAGSLKDSKSLYTRAVPYDDPDGFKIHGNYFTIETLNEGANAFPLVTNTTHDGFFGHSALFGFGGDNHHKPADYYHQGKVEINDLYLVGNSQKTSDRGNLNGGLTAILTSAKELTLNNCRTRGFVSHINSNGSYSGSTYTGTMDTVVNINYTKMIDSYNTMFLAWGSKQNTINNSVIKETGGPLIVATHVGTSTERDGANKETFNEMYSNIDVVDSVISSPVSGTEIWFEKIAPGGMAKALMTGNFAAVNVGFNTVSFLAEQQGLNVTKSGIKNEIGAFNFILCSMGEDNVGNTAIINNTITITNNSEVVCDSDMNDPYLAAYVEGISSFGLDPTQLTAFPFIYEANGVYLTFDITLDEGEDKMGMARGMSLLTPTSQMPIAINAGLFKSDNYLENAEFKELIDTSLESFFNADYVNIILGGQRFSCTFGLFHDLT